MKSHRLQIISLIMLFLILLDMTFYRFNSFHIYQSVFNKINNPYSIHVDLDYYKMYVLKNGEVIKTYPVSGGKKTTPSPLGTWTIISKADWGEGFGGTWMGFNVPWGKYGIHGTDEPWSIGNPMSHGCIRMKNEDAKELKDMIPHGTKVTIVKGVFGPFGDYFRTLEPGDTGSDVLMIQKKLNNLGYYNGYCDGKYGDNMKNAVHKFQKDNNLPTNNKITLEMYEKLGFIPME
ncbi:L,D-transpeptidase family protein [Defluviitalea phaphyphila]|uniref:L,D-transpeptidase family protein n=1 Tax=Defluviitalea phaphyphila TaxID=1473580 RepID=UPI000731C0AB|nr:L,D-transpeptidase family protein [Defluviitalea phaphyphila]